jgi:hypothetical protein
MKAPMLYQVHGLEKDEGNEPSRTTLAEYLTYSDAVAFLRKYVVSEDAGGWTYFEIVAIDIDGISMTMLEVEAHWHDD